MSGTLAGKPTTHDVDAEWVLKREYLRFHEVSREKDAGGGPAYEAIVFLSWEANKGEYGCLWMDNTEGGALSSDVIARAAGDPCDPAGVHESGKRVVAHDIPVRCACR